MNGIPFKCQSHEWIVKKLTHLYESPFVEFFTTFEHKCWLLLHQKWSTITHKSLQHIGPFFKVVPNPDLGLVEEISLTFWSHCRDSPNVLSMPHCVLLRRFALCQQTYMSTVLLFTSEQLLLIFVRTVWAFGQTSCSPWKYTEEHRDLEHRNSRKFR